MLISQMQKEQGRLRQYVPILQAQNKKEKVDQLTDQARAAKTYKVEAPMLQLIITSLTRNQQKKDDAKNDDTNDYSMQALIVVSILNVCSSKHSSTMQRILSIYIRGDNSKKRIIIVLNKLSVTKGQSSLSTIQNDVVTCAKAGFLGRYLTCTLSNNRLETD